MNDFNKIYTAETLKNNKIVTLVTIPMEESIMVPVAQIVDLMKQGENVLFFSFKHDSIKINEFLVAALKSEPNPEGITGGLSIFDSHQVPTGVDYLQFIEEQVADISGLLKNEKGSLSFIFLDLPEKSIDDDKIVDSLARINFTHKVTSVLVSKLNMPVFTAHQLQKPDECEKNMDEFIGQNMISQMLKTSTEILQASDLVLGVQREKENFWKKLINFLLFWRKRNNFTLKILKNRNGSDGKSHKMNIDMENFKVEIL